MRRAYLTASCGRDCSMRASSATSVSCSGATAVEGVRTFPGPSVYRDPAVLKVNPWYKSFFPVIKSALPRPVSKYEAKISDRVTRQVHAALLKQVDVATALNNAQKDVEQIIGGNTP